ncbi:MAG: SPFH domain-containing protein, partial [Planctomycetota bacterium]|nr:SPFH domain-containing protein [Planctomycetota bacterium]
MAILINNRPAQDKVPIRAIAALLIIAIGLFLALATIYTGVTTIAPGEIGVIQNNLFGICTPHLTNGTIIHLPFGLTKVYKLDKTVQSLTMAGPDSVQIKTNDGSNVQIDMEVQYQIIPAKAIDIIRTIGAGDAYKQGLVRAYARSSIRDSLGYLSVVEIADPNNIKTEEIKARLNSCLEKYGIVIGLITPTNIAFNPEYEKMIRSRKEADQDVRNEQEAQKTAQQEQERRLAEANRLKSVAIRQAEGELNAQKIAAQAEAERLVQQAKGKAYAIKREGEQALMAAQNEAAAIEAEGLNRAQGLA